MRWRSCSSASSRSACAPSWTSTATGANLNLTGNLLVHGSNTLTSLAIERNISDSYSKTETDSFLATKTGVVDRCCCG